VTFYTFMLLTSLANTKHKT